MRCEVVGVNPSEVVSAEGVQRYPKGTFRIRYTREKGGGWEGVGGKLGGGAGYMCRLYVR